jgi:hypothetical protein
MRHRIEDLDQPILFPNKYEDASGLLMLMKIRNEGSVEREREISGVSFSFSSSVTAAFPFCCQL